ncbi:MAG: phenylalanine--tRNA ligase subunit beta [Actinobacteria bacterium]|nr:phenylalanine--tRNA ligase subunit beta [Actinomycetota bacterium]
MRVPYSWLREYCDPGLPIEELADRLVMTGTEVERIDVVGPPSPDNFVIGKVTEAVQHPDADRLRVCTVDVGEGGARTIVCGAPNVGAGQTVAVALPGARMPGGDKLRKAKLRGVASEGMILAADEIEVGEDHDGIMVLDDALSAGTPLADVIPLAEPVLEIEVTPNRSDCFGVHGIAREVHAVTGADLGPDPWADDAPAEGEGQASDFASVTIEVPDLCPRFTARVFRDVKIGPSPLWLRERLAAAGQRPISNVVDITNYVMLLTAQPLHAYDLDKLPGGELIVRTAREGEKMTTLDGVERELDPEIVLVCDRDRPSGIGGVMGGQVSEVSDETTSLLLEAANWNGPNILQTSRRLSLRSEASARFEKQLHPDLTMRAQAVASKLIVELCGATMVPGTIDVAAPAPEPRTLRLRGSRVTSILGMEIPQADQVAYLERQGFAVEVDGEDLLATVPADRYYDVTREIDLIEEVGRLHGFDRHLPTTLPRVGEGKVGRLNRTQRLRRRAEDELRDLGFDQIVGWSFNNPGEAGRLRTCEPDPRAEPILVANPLSDEGAAMRTTLIGSLLDVAARNLSRGAEAVSLFEAGAVYLRGTPPETGGPLAGDFPGDTPAPVTEPHRYGALAVGPLIPRSWRGGSEPADFFALKGVLEALAASLGCPPLEFEPTAEPFLHPGRGAAVAVGGAPLGWLGEIHPLVCRTWDIDAAVGFEIDAAPLLAAATLGEELFEDVTTFPAALRDLAVVVDSDTSAATVRAAVLAGGGELLRAAKVFDLYEGPQLAEGKKSLALALEFRAADRTLTDEEVDAARASIEAELTKIGGELRA